MFMTLTPTVSGGSLNAAQASAVQQRLRVFVDDRSILGGTPRAPPKKPVYKQTFLPSSKPSDDAL
jgi:hypothetical protein